MFPVLSDPGLHEFIGGAPPISEKALEERYIKLETRKSPDGEELWLNWVMMRSDRRPIGYVQASVNIDHADIAWVVGTEWQGNGYASEAAAALSNWLRANEISRITASVNSKHTTSQRVAFHAGLAPTDEVSEGEEVWEWISQTAAPFLLRDVVESDLPAFFEHQGDPEAVRMAAFPAKTREVFMAHWKEKILADETVIKRTILFHGQVAGNIVCFEQSGKRLVGYWLGKQFWNKNIATRALAAFLELVETRPLDAYVARGNVGSVRVLEKCGFVQSREGNDPTGAADVEELLFTLPINMRGRDPKERPS